MPSKSVVGSGNSTFFLQKPGLTKDKSEVECSTKTRMKSTWCLN